jgi:hypothetical protein
MLISVLWLLPEYTPGGNDREIFRFMGRSIDDGLMPYKNCFDHKPPLIYLIYYFTAFAGEWDIFIAGTFFLFISIFLIKSQIQSKNKISQWLIPIFLLIWLRNPLFYEYGGLTREYTAYLYCIFFFIVVGNYKIGWLYLIAGLVFITQQNDILPLLPLLVYKTKTQGKLKTMGIFLNIMLFFAPFLLVSLWLLNGAAFQNFIDQAFVFNYTFYSKPLSALHPEAIIRLTNQFVQKINFGIIGLAVLFIFHLITKKTGYSIVILLSVFLGIFNVVMSGRFYGHYFLPLGPILAFAFIVLDADAAGSKFKNIAISLAICSFIISIFWDNRHFSLSKQKELAEQNQKVLKQMQDIIIRNSNELKHLSAINYSPAFPLYSKYKAPPSSRYIYFSPWDEIPSWDNDLKLYSEYINSLNKAGTIVFDFTPHHPFVRNEMNIGLSMALNQNHKEIGKIKDDNGKVMAIVYLCN